MRVAREVWLKMNTGVLISQFPHLLRTGDIKYRGGVFFKGIASGASGIQSHLDEMVGVWVKSAIAAMAQEAIDKNPGDADEDHFKLSF